MAELDRITRDASVMGGRPCIRGTRVTVGTIVGLLSAEYTIDAVLDEYPNLERADVLAALAYAAWRARELELPLKRTEGSDSRSALQVRVEEHDR